jgi:ubiquinone/menaquinone biosynthesis C-methylase UbiE
MAPRTQGNPAADADEVSVVTDAEAYVEISDLERASSRAELAKAFRAAALGWVRDGAHILDAGAGQGWHALALSESHVVVGVDQDERLVTEACLRSRVLPVAERPRFLRSSLQALRLPENAMDLVYSLNTSIGYESVEADWLTLKNLARILHPGATLVLETLSASEADAAEPALRKIGDAQIAVVRRFDPATSVFEERQRLHFECGTDAVFSYRVLAYDPSDLAALAHEAGFTRVTILGSLDGDSWRPEDPVVIVARTASSPRFQCIVARPPHVAVRSSVGSREAGFLRCLGREDSDRDARPPDSLHLLASSVARDHRRADVSRQGGASPSSWRPGVLGRADGDHSGGRCRPLRSVRR